MFQLHISTNQKYYTYLMYDLDELVYVGHGKLKDIITLKDVIPCQEFEKNIFYKIVSHSEHEQKYQAYNAAAKLMHEHGTPKFNKALQYVNTHSMPVKCVQDGKIYVNAATAARAYNIQESRMSKHILRKPGHKSIYGMTFERVNISPDERKNLLT